MTPHDAQPAAPLTVEVEFPEAGIAVVCVRGEHDLSTKARLSEALATASEQPNVLVDLCECTFMDSSVIAAMFVARKKLGERDGRLEIVIPPEAGTIQRVASITSLAAILPIHATRSAGLASLRSVEHFIQVRDLRAAWATQRRTPRSVRSAVAAVLVETTEAGQPA
jgi:anti-anti-sigma factor